MDIGRRSAYWVWAIGYWLWDIGDGAIGRRSAYWVWDAALMGMGYRVLDMGYWAMGRLRLLDGVPPMGYGR